MRHNFPILLLLFCETELRDDFCNIFRAMNKLSRASMNLSLTHKKIDCTFTREAEY